MSIQMVVLDAMGVIYTDGDDVGALVVPLARSKLCALGEPEIDAAYTDASAGKMTSTKFWNALGMPNVDDEFVRLYELTPGLREFLLDMQAAGVPVGCISNDIAEWATLRRRLLGIDGLIDPWVVSGAVRIRKPDEAIFRVFLERSGRDASQCLFIDDRTVNLDAARVLGFQTAHFHPSLGVDNGLHRCMESFAELRAMVLGETS